MGKRVQQEPSWLLHYRPFRDSSQILDLLTREHGRLAVVARGSRAAKSRLKGVLRPFLPLRTSWVIRSDLGTLTGAEMNGDPIMLTGDALLSGYYMNELLLNLLHRHDPHPEIFDLYGDTISKLASRHDISPLLRSFEIELLRMLGYALNLDHDTQSHQALAADAEYEYRPEYGPVEASGRPGVPTYAGKHLAAIAAQAFSQPEVLRDAGRLLRDVISFHLDGKELKSRKVMVELKRSRQ